VTDISDSAFKDCTSLTEVTFLNDLSGLTIGNSAFTGISSSAVFNLCFANTTLFQDISNIPLVAAQSMNNTCPQIYIPLDKISVSTPALQSTNWSNLPGTYYRIYINNTDPQYQNKNVYKKYNEEIYIIYLVDSIYQYWYFTEITTPYDTNLNNFITDNPIASLYIYGQDRGVQDIVIINNTGNYENNWKTRSSTNAEGWDTYKIIINRIDV